MVDLNKKSKVRKNIVLLAVVIGAIYIATVIFGLQFFDKEPTSSPRHDTYSGMIACSGSDAICDVPGSNPEQEDVGAYFIEGDGQSTPPQLIQAPTTEFPYGDLEGSRVSILIEPNSDVWSEFKNSIIGLDPVSSETLTRNLTRKLEEQEGRNLDLVNAGEVYTLDLNWEPSPYVTPLPSESSPQEMCTVRETPTMTEYRAC